MIPSILGKWYMDFTVLLIICSKNEVKCHVVGNIEQKWWERERKYIDQIPLVRPLAQQQCDRVQLHSIVLSLPQHRPIQQVSLFAPRSCVCVCVC